MIDTAAVRRALSARFDTRRFTPRTRRLRTVGAAGFAGVSVTLLGAELPASGAPRTVATRPDFATNELVKGHVAVPVRFDDPAATAFLEPGDRIDVLTAEDRGDAPGTVPDALAPRPRDEARQRDQAAIDVPVIAVPSLQDAPGDAGIRGGNPPRTSSGVDGLVLLAVDNATAARLAAAAARGRLSFALHPASESG